MSHVSRMVTVAVSEPQVWRPCLQRVVTGVISRAWGCSAGIEYFPVLTGPGFNLSPSLVPPTRTVQAGLEFTVLLPWVPEYGDYRCLLLCLMKGFLI